ncbi:MAG TPA: carbon-nitrogen hydrolase family protein [archaeon]|nr:carbon-nitrogen hydrolase family protein [archaeon]
MKAVVRVFLKKNIFFLLTPAAFFALSLLSFENLIAADAERTGAQVGQLIFHADSFPAGVDSRSVPGWDVWSQRAETRPFFFTTELPSLGKPGSLGISGASNNSAHGCWQKVVSGIKPGAWYRFEASFQTESVPYPRRQVLSRLEWLDPDSKRTSQPEYVQEVLAPGHWQKNAGTFQAPEKAHSVRIELFLSYCPQGRVWWDDISLAQVSAPPKRMARVATVNCYPRNKANSAESVAEFLPLMDEAGRNGCDIVCLGEGINLVGVSGVRYPDIAEPIPGPTTKTLGEMARKHKMYIVAALGERENQAIYNTAVLIDREGRVAGKYHKAYLPREEIEAGCTPGNSYPVFDTDFGRIGMMICWDLQYVDPARALAVKGAEIIFLPIWGGNPVLAKARAIENQIYLVSSAYNSPPTAVYAPTGEMLIEVKERPSVKYVDIDLNYKYKDNWLGYMKDRFPRERRADIVEPELER